MSLADEAMGEPSLVDGVTIGTGRISLLMRDAETSGMGEIARLCWAALSEGEPTSPTRLSRPAWEARDAVARIWNDRVAQGTEPRGGPIGDLRGIPEFDVSYELAPGGGLDGLLDDTVDPYETGESTANRPLVLSLVEFSCPMCHTPGIRAEDVRGGLRIPWHRRREPIYPFGYGGPMYRAECPASFMAITQICDGDHGRDPCDDPQCWLTSPVAEERWDASEKTAAAPAYVEAQLMSRRSGAAR